MWSMSFRGSETTEESRKNKDKTYSGFFAIAQNDEMGSRFSVALRITSIKK